ncbi:MAG: HAD hydrolase-like protein [Gammaproteobacteria bacterium]|nr:HAD hydrolase-like protein [Gammaproteobacteria bacterium]
MMNVFLDLDGTLTDPGPGFVRSIGHALDKLGVATPPEADIVSHIGPPLEETLAKLLGPDSLALVPEAVRWYRERYFAVGLYENTVYDGIYEALQAIKSSGARMFLATAKPTRVAARILRHFELDGFFEACYGSELDGTNSDKRDLLKYLLARETLNPADSVMVGDRSHDVRAALANGVRSLAVLWGYGSLPELQEAGAEQIIREPVQLADAVLITSRS